MEDLSDQFATTLDEEMNSLIFVALSVAEVLSQGFYIDLNGTNYNSYVSSESMTLNNNMPSYQFDEVLNHYRSDTRKREPQFLGFDIQDDNIEIDMEIAVPFLSVPTKKSLQNRRKAYANINVAGK